MPVGKKSKMVLSLIESDRDSRRRLLFHCFENGKNGAGNVFSSTNKVSQQRRGIVWPPTSHSTSSTKYIHA